VALSPGTRWVDQFLRPLLGRLELPPGASRFRCLQLEADDEEEALRLRQEGHDCHILLFDRRRLAERLWQEPPLLAEELRLPMDTASIDLVFTGYFGRLTRNCAGRQALAGEFGRVCRKGGAVLLSIGNRRCPVDLSGNAPARLHGCRCASLMTLRELEQLFLGECGFAMLEPLSLANQFGWSRLSRLPRWVTAGLEGYLRVVSMPGRPWLYGSVISPLLCCWIRR